ncbi:MAG: TolC family outer membrane protein [Rhodocyclaceae bacterium]|nr:TolC family outer membrane protein [Rhodocyclaceae bacterium]
MKKSFAFFLGFLGTSCFSLNALGADLLEVYRSAQGYDAQYAAAKAQLSAGREKLPQGRSGVLPSVSFSANTNWNDLESRARATGTTVDRRYNSNGWNVTLTQPLFRWQNWVGLRQSELAVMAAELQMAQAEQDLAMRVAQAYFDVLLAQETLTTVRAQKAAIAEQLDAAKRNFEVGTATITDTHEAQARFDLIVAQEIAAENDLVVKRQSLATLTGEAPERLKRLKDMVRIDKPQPDALEHWVAAAESDSLLVKLAQANLEIAQRETEKQRAGHYPTLDLVATHGKSSSGFSTTGGYDNTTSTIGLQFVLPLYAGGGISSREREAAALAEKARAELEQARRQAALAARQAYLGVNAGLAQIRALEAGVKSSELALESNKLGYEVGVRINIDVLNAQSQLYDTRQKLAKARIETLLSQLKLKAAAGSLGAEDLAAINTLLE